MSKQIFFDKLFDESTNEVIRVITEEGRKELARLEPKYFPTMRSDVKRKYPHFTEEEKLDTLISKKKREDKKAGPMKVHCEVKHIKPSLNDIMYAFQEIDWLTLDIDKIESIEKKLISIMEEAKAAKELILSEKIEKELSVLKEQRSDIDSKIQELELAKINIFGKEAA